MPAVISTTATKPGRRSPLLSPGAVLVKVTAVEISVALAAW
jgi:hypothetical protein